MAPPLKPLIVGHSFRVTGRLLGAPAWGFPLYQLALKLSAYSAIKGTVLLVYNFVDVVIA